MNIGDFVTNDGKRIFKVLCIDDNEAWVIQWNGPLSGTRLTFRVADLKVVTT